MEPFKFESFYVLRFYNSENVAFMDVIKQPYGYKVELIGTPYYVEDTHRFNSAQELIDWCDNLGIKVKETELEVLNYVLDDEGVAVEN